MSRSEKPRFGQNCSLWKDTVGMSRCQAKARSKWRKLGSRALRRSGFEAKTFVLKRKRYELSDECEDS